MKRQIFGEAVLANAARVKRYQLGHDGSDGSCDCIGLIIGAIRIAGGKWSGTHGSNWSARNAMASLQRLNSVNQLKVFSIVYKAVEKGSSAWKLPSAYAGHKDQNDYYHVGVVTSLSPLTITHCTGVDGGIKRDYSIKGWTHVGQLSMLDSEPAPVAEGKVRTTAKAVALRKGPSTQAGVYLRIPEGTEADIVPIPKGWTCVSYKGTIGFVMDQFLMKGGTDK